jgi:putative NAD(P)H nitroreductase
MEFESLSKQRHTERNFAPNVKISDQQLQALFQKVILGPSAFNLQHWQFIAIREQTAKNELYEIAYYQPQVKDCSSAVVVCGNLLAFRDTRRIYENESKDIRDKFSAMVKKIYEHDVGLQRDEVMRSASLAAMSLMYAAADKKWASAPLIGFDVDKLATKLCLPESVIPVMLVLLGKPKSGNSNRRGYRRSLEEVLHFETYKS